MWKHVCLLRRISRACRVHLIARATQGGVKLLPEIIRNFLGSDPSILMTASKVLSKCCMSSPALQHGLLKEKV